MENNIRSDLSYELPGDFRLNEIALPNVREVPRRRRQLIHSDNARPSALLFQQTHKVRGDKTCRAGDERGSHGPLDGRPLRKRAGF